MADSGDVRAPEESAPARRLRKRRRNRILRWALLLVVAAVVVILTAQAVRAYVALRGARGDVESVRQDLGRGDFTAAEAHVRALSAHARTARGASDGFMWDLLAHVPFVGDDVHAVQVLSHALDEVSGKP